MREGTTPPARGFDFGLSGRARLGCVALGFFLSLAGVFAAFLVNRGESQSARGDAVRFASYGVLAELAVVAIAATATWLAPEAAMSAWQLLTR